MASRTRLLAGGIHILGVLLMGAFSWWFSHAAGNAVLGPWLLIIIGALISYSVVRRVNDLPEPIRRHLALALLLQAANLLTPLVTLLVGALPFVGVPGFRWIDPKLGLVVAGPFIGWTLQQVIPLWFFLLLSLLAAAIAIRGFRGQ